MSQLKFGLSGHYTLRATNPETGQVREWEFDNLITDWGLEQIGADQSRDLITRFQLGTGTSAPVASDPLLGVGGPFSDSLGTTLNSGPNYFGRGYVAGPPPYVWHEIRRRFQQGVAQGTWTEIGCGPSSGSNMFSRALILDGGGSPTSITILPIEVLDVIYQFRVYPPTGDVTGSATIGGVSTNYTLRASRINDNWWASNFVISGRFGVGMGSATVFTGAIGSITGQPSGTAVTFGSGTHSAYSAGSLVTNFTFNASTTQGNLAGGIRSFQSPTLNSAGASNTLQIEFSPNINKDDTKTLSLTFSMSWARRS